jgi:hypothetical protein
MKTETIKKDAPKAVPAKKGAENGGSDKKKGAKKGKDKRN